MNYYLLRVRGRHYTSSKPYFEFLTSTIPELFTRTLIPDGSILHQWIIIELLNKLYYTALDWDKYFFYILYCLHKNALTVIGKVKSPIVAVYETIRKTRFWVGISDF